MLVLLDRDGVINVDRKEGIFELDQFIFLPRVIEAVAMLTKAGHKTSICTNQSAVGRGLLPLATLEAIHAHMQAEFQKGGGRIDRIYFAPDVPEAPTERRKPGAGMLLEALRDFNTPPAQTIYVGDMLRDLEAAQKASIPSILVRCGKGQGVLDKGIPPQLMPVAICDDLFAAAHYIIEHSPPA